MGIETVLGIVLVASMFVLLFWSGVDRTDRHQSRFGRWSDRATRELKRIQRKWEEELSDQLAAAKINEAAAIVKAV